MAFTSNLCPISHFIQEEEKEEKRLSLTHPWQFVDMMNYHH